MGVREGGGSRIIDCQCVFAKVEIVVGRHKPSRAEDTIIMMNLAIDTHTHTRIQIKKKTNTHTLIKTHMLRGGPEIISHKSLNQTGRQGLCACLYASEIVYVCVSLSLHVTAGMCVLRNRLLLNHAAVMAHRV